MIEKTSSTVSVSNEHTQCTRAHVTRHIHTPHDIEPHQQRKHKVIVISLCFFYIHLSHFLPYFCFVCVCGNVCISMSKELLKNCPYQVTYPRLLFHDYSKQLRSLTSTEEQLTWIKVFITSGSWQFDSVVSGPGAGYHNTAVSVGAKLLTS